MRDENKAKKHHPNEPAHLHERSAKGVAPESSCQQTGTPPPREHELLVRILQATPVGIVVADREGRITFCNGQAEQILGLTGDETTSYTYDTPRWHITDFDGNPLPDEALPFQRVMVAEQPISDIQRIFEWPDGRKRFFSINAAPLFDNSGAIEGIVATLNDITQQVVTEKARRESAQFCSIFESIPMGMHMYQLKEDGRLVLTDYNPASASILGIDHTQLVGKTIEEAFPELAQTEIPEACRRVAASGEVWQTAESDCQEGQIARVLEVHTFQALPGRVVAAFLDVTKRKRTEQALRESEAKLQSIFRAAPIGIGLVTDRILQWINDMLCQMTGYSEDDLIGQSARLMYETQEEFLRVGREKYAEIAQDGIGTIETRFVRKDGRPIDVLLSSCPLDPNDLSAGVTFTALDITERREAEKALRRRTEQLEALRRTSLVLGSTLDHDRVLEHLLNQIAVVVPYDSANIMWLEDGIARITHHRGYERAGTAEATAALLLSVEETPNLRRMYSTGQPHVVPDTWADPQWVQLIPTRWIRSWAGAPIIVQDQVIAFFCLDSGTPGTYGPEHGDLLAAFAAHAAVAIENARLYDKAQLAYKELKQTQAQLIQSAKLAAVGQLAAGVAHELNNPLTSVLGFAELLLLGTDPDDPAREDLSVIADEARRARDIVRGLLDFARQSPSMLEDANLNLVVKETLDLIRRQISNGRVVLEEHYAENLPAIPLSVSRMKQVFLNLITNALYAMPEGGTLTLRSEQVGDRAAVRIIDTGTGIPADLLSRIFDPFFTTKPVGEGTGLGLSVSLGIVLEHGGQITVESQLGEGSQFTVWLPLEAPEGG
jgi:PAS domain S-box-containing protein